jgi:hypothetical protein
MKAEKNHLAVVHPTVLVTVQTVAVVFFQEFQARVPRAQGFKMPWVLEHALYSDFRP